ncbi:unnamed protein product [Gadus morhua 'NCC']
MCSHGAFSLGLSLASRELHDSPPFDRSLSPALTPGEAETESHLAPLSPEGPVQTGHAVAHHVPGARCQSSSLLPPDGGGGSGHGQGRGLHRLQWALAGAANPHSMTGGYRLHRGRSGSQRLGWIPEVSRVTCQPHIGRRYGECASGQMAPQRAAW